VGTGCGGGRCQTGEIIPLLFDEMEQAAQTFGYDVVLVTNEAPTFAAAQAERSRRVGNPQHFPQMTACLQNELEGIARDIARDNLVLFLGAGISAGAGLPLWAKLLDDLASAAEMSAAERKALQRYDFLEQAMLVQQRMEALGFNMKDEIAKRIKASSIRFSLQHALLSGLGVTEVVTTNYDDLFERASSCAGHRLAVLPGEEAAGGRFLVKMHGCVHAPEDIVLSRDDYLGYNDRRAALTGIVQCLLVTKKLVFVGFSLSDYNFHQIHHSVRRGQQSKCCKATSFQLIRDPLQEELWNHSVDVISMDEPYVGPDSGWRKAMSEAARHLEIFLDLLSIEVSSKSGTPLLDTRYNDLLTPSETKLKNALRSFLEECTEDNALATGCESWRHVQALLSKLGDEHPRLPLQRKALMKELAKAKQQHRK
jgi:hypothetical protein